VEKGIKMKMCLPKVTAIVLSISAVLVPTVATADHHIPAQIEAQVRGFHRSMNAGNFEDMFAQLALGMNAYLTYGFLKELPNETAKAAVLEMYKDSYEQGFRTDLRPQYIKVSVHGTCAIATFLREGTVTEPGEERPTEVLERGTFVYAQVEDKWLIVHVHVSSLQKSDEDDD
jgi:hypothetical protein